MTKPYRFIFMGTPSFSAGVLKSLCENGLVPCAVYNQPDRVNGRGHKIAYSPVKEYALSRSIPVEQPRTLRTEEEAAKLKKYRPDLLIVVAYGQILPQNILDIPTYGAVNIHASLLPKYRGSSPIQTAILNGDTETGITIMKLNAGMDTGDILLQKKVSIPPSMTGGGLFDYLSHVGSRELLSFMAQFPSIMEKGRKQDDSKASYTHKLTKEMGEIDWTQPASCIDRLIRGLYPDPGTFTFYRGKRLKIHEAHPENFDSNVPPGHAASLEGGLIHIQTGKGMIALSVIQPENHKKMAAKDFINGHQVKINDQFGK